MHYLPNGRGKLVKSKEGYNPTSNYTVGRPYLV